MVEFVTPCDIEAEIQVISGCLVSKHSFPEIREIIGSPKVFYRDNHSKIWRAMCTVFDAGKPVDLFSLRQELRKSIGFDEMAEYLAGICNHIPGRNTRAAAEIVADKAIRRDLVEAGNTVLQSALNESLDIHDLVSSAQSSVMAVSAFSSASKAWRGMDELNDSVKAAAELTARNGAVMGMTIGFREFDSRTMGFQHGDLVAIVGRSGMGKSSFALAVADHVAVECYKQVIIFEGEMSGEQLFLRMLCSRAQIRSKDFRYGLRNKDEVNRAKEASEKLSKSGIRVVDRGPITPSMMRMECRAMKRKQGLNLVIVDYLELMEADKKVENEVQRLDYLVRQLKAIAIEFNCVVMVLCQMGRAVESRTDRRPVLSDIRGSGGIEAALDWGLGIYNQNYYVRQQSPEKFTHDPGRYEPDVVEISTLKARSDIPVSFNVAFIPAYTRFSDPKNSLLPTGF